MIRAHCRRRRLSFRAIASGLTLLFGFAVPGCGVQQPADIARPPAQLSEAERARRLQERDQLFEETHRLANSGRLDEAVAALGRVLATEREVLGGLHEDVVTALALLSQIHEGRGDWKAARAALEEGLAIRERQPDRNEWRIADVRRALVDLDRRAEMTPQQRSLLLRAQMLNRTVLDQNSRGQYAAAMEAASEALRIRKELLGEGHPDFAQSLNNLAGRYNAMGDFARAEPLYRQALEICRKALGEGHPSYATSLNNLALLYRAMGDSARAESLCRQALEIWRKALGEGHPSYATSLNNLALLYKDMGDFARAEPLFRQALEIRRKALGEGHPDYAASLNNLAALYKDMDDFARAEPLHRQVLEIRRKALGEGHPDYAASLNNLAELYQSMGDFARAEPLHRQALEIVQKALGEGHPDYAKGLNNLAVLNQSIGDFSRAELLHHQALEIRKKALGEGHPDYATSLNNLAALYHAMSDSARAELLFRQALEIRKKALGEGHPDYAASLNNLAELYRGMGDFARAEPLHRQALEIRKKVLGEGHPDYATSFNYLALVHQSMGDFARAEPLYRQALEIRKKVLGEGHPHYAASLANLASVYQSVGDFPRAEPLYRQAIETMRKALGESHPDYAQGLNNLAGLYWAMGDFARAEPLHRQALEIRKKVLGEAHPRYAASLANLALVYQSVGDFLRAEPLYRQAIEIERKALGEGHPDYAMSLSNLAKLYHAMGNFSRAEPLLKQSLEINSAFVHTMSEGLGERQHLRLHEDRRFALDAYLTVAPEVKSRSEELHRFVLDWKGSATERFAEDRLARDQPELRPAFAQLTAVRAQLAQLAFATPSDAQRFMWRQQFDAMRERKENLEADLAHQSAAFRQEQRLQTLGPEEVAAALPTGTVLVDLLEYTHFTPPQEGKGEFQREWRVLAFVLRAGQPVALVPLGTVQPISEAVVAWRRALEGGQADALQKAAAELSRRVWEPLRPHLANARTVLIAPDGELSRFPFGALPGSRPGSYLVEEIAIGYVASGRQVVEVLSPPQSPAGRGLLAAGAIDYQTDPGRSAPLDRPPAPMPVVAQRAGFQPLPGTGPEAQQTRDLFVKTFADQPIALLTKAEPTEAELKRRLDGGHWRIVHLATHGFFESPARIAALRAADRRENPFAQALQARNAGETDDTFALTPFLRSGVVLAGGGREPGPSDPATSAPAREDGILTAEEVQALDLRGTELVVLSACETGLGALEYGQGVLGLQRAFQSAGARAVVASLWKVDDAATSVLMEQFYRNLWEQKLPKLEALRQAQLAVLNDPGLVTRRRAELTQRGLGLAAKLPGGGAVSSPVAPGARSSPALWAAFLLSGDVR